MSDNAEVNYNPKVNDNPNVPFNMVTPSLKDLQKACYQGLVNLQPEDANSFILGFYTGYYGGVNKPIHPYVSINIECGRLDRLVRED